MGRLRIKKSNGVLTKQNEVMRTVITTIAQHVGFKEPPNFEQLLNRIDSMAALAVAYGKVMGARAESEPAEVEK